MQAACEHGGGLREIRVDALLPAVRALGPQAEPLRRAQDADRLEVRRLEQHLGRLVAHLALGPPMIAASATGFVAVGDQEVALVERRRVPSSVRISSPARARRTDDAAAVELRAVERVQRASVDVHDVVRDVDDVRDRPHPGCVQAGPQPHRRRADGDVPEDAADVARAASGSSTTISTHSGCRIGGSVDVDGQELAVEQGRHLARQADHREQVDAVHRRRHVQHLRRAPAGRPRAASPARSRRAAA